MKHAYHAHKRHAKERYYFISFIACFALALIVGTIVHYTQTYHATAQQSERSKAELARLDEQTKQTVARKAAEVEAKRQADAKATAATVTSLSQDQAATLRSSRCNATMKHSNPAVISVLVNKKHCMQPLTYAPSGLISAYGALLHPEAAAAFTQLYEAAERSGYPLSVTSSYRSYNEQVTTYRYWVGISGVKGADTYSARPGYSEHQTGLAVDVASRSGCSLDCFGATPQYQWLDTHASEYGFIQRYHDGHEAVTGYKAEEWHYRYVGTNLAKDMKQKGIKTLEQYWNIPGGDY